MSEFVNYLHEVFELFGPIRSRKMFGGHGIYFDDLMFGLVADDELFLKADEQSIAEFEALDLSPYQYHGKTFNMSYYRAPEEIYDDPDQALVWANIAYDAAVRSANIKKR